MKEAFIQRSDYSSIEGLKKSKQPEAKHALQELENDPDSEKEIKSWRRSK